MKAMNALEEKALEMLAEAKANNKTLHGWAREVIIEMTLREAEEEAE